MPRFLASELHDGDVMKGLDALEAKVREQVLAAGAAAAAKVIYDEAKINASRHRQSGKLAEAIYRAYSASRSGPDVATYHVSWNKRKAPHGHLIEYGHFQRYQAVLLDSGEWISLKNRPLPAPRWVPPRPFIRPAADRMRDAVKAGVEAMRQEMAR